MAEVACTLKDGLKAKDTRTGQERVLKAVVLKELSAGEIIDANRDAERVAVTPDGPMLVVSPSEAMRQMLRRHIKSIEDISGPIEEEMFNGLSGEDLKILDSHAKKFGKITSKEVGQSGRADSEG